MKNLNLSLLLSIFSLCLTSTAISQNENFSMRELACDLSQPWEIKMGPDDFLWVTEAHSYEISRIDPITGSTELLIDLSNKKNFPDFNEAETWPQGGLQGLVFHPEFDENPYVYIAYVYQFDGCLPDSQGCFFKTKIVRFDYNPDNGVLSNEMVVIETLPGSTDHNGGRLAIGPESAGMEYLFYSIGDMGAGQLGNFNREHNGQNPNIYEGKILRFNLKPDGDPDYFDSWIPNDNPFNETNDQNAVWSLGHRNPQGLVFSPDGKLYASEHGPYSDDEINLIQPGYNYGFPYIMGFTDGNYNGSAAGDGPTLPVIVSETANRSLIELSYPYSDPLGSYLAPPQSEVSTLYTDDVNNTPPFDFAFLQNPTIAPSDLAYYSSDAIPDWKNSLLVPAMKLGRIYRLKLSGDGMSITSDTIPYFEGLGRFRDIAISADGMKLFVTTDSTGLLKGAPGVAVQPPNKGCILEFTYEPTSTDELALDKAIQFYPNPVRTAPGRLSIRLEEDAEVAVDLYSATGQKIATVVPLETAKVFEKNIEMDQYQPGSYFLKVQIDGTSVLRKIVRL